MRKVTFSRTLHFITLQIHVEHDTINQGYKFDIIAARFEMEIEVKAHKYEA